MAFVVSVENFRPTPRHDGVLWVEARLEESLYPTGPWSPLGLTDITAYPDASQPPEIDLTSDEGTINPNVAYYRVVFIDPDGNVNESDPIGPSGYPTTEEFVADSSVSELTSLGEAEQDALRTASINAVEEFCNQTFTLEMQRSYTLDGTGTGVLYLPRRILNLTDIIVPESTVSPSEVIINERRDRLILWEGVSTTGYYQTAIRDLADAWPVRFTFGMGNIVILGDWGWEAVPSAVKVAIRKDMEDTALADANGLSQTARAFRKMGMRDVSQGNLRAAVSGAYGLSPEVMSLLDRYVWIGQIGAVA